MSAITDITEAWRGHSGLEVETFLKQMLGSTVASLGGKIGYVELVGSTLTFYDEEGGNVISAISLSGDVYNIAIASNLPQAFYVLGDETSKIMTLTPSTTVSPFGSTTHTPFPETYHYQIAINTGSGYVMRLDDYTHSSGESVSFDVKNWLVQGDNYIRVTMEGQTSGQVRSVVYTATLTNLWMTVSHTWQTAWEEGQDYVINGIRFSGSLAKTLHIAVNGVELMDGQVNYSASQNYTTTATTYTVPASAFPASEGSDAFEIKLWMTAQGVSTPERKFNILCIAEGDDTPLIAINDITPIAYNWTSGRLFGYAVYGADTASFDLTASLGGQTYTIATGVTASDLVPNTQYDFAYSLEVDTGANTNPTGTLQVAGTASYGSTTGESDSVSTVFDNTYSYLATPGALFYMNASTRANSQEDRDTIVNEMGASPNFPATYSAEWENFSWDSDGWSVDPNGNRALVIPAGCSLSVPDFHPLSYFNNYSEGMTFEVLLRNQYPADYDTPVFSLYDTEANPTRGILIYPTKIVVISSTERDEISQMVNFSENKITHIVVSFVKGYEGPQNGNICSIYINGISNANFAFTGGWGAASLYIGQPDTDVYLYKMRVYGTALDSQAVFNNFLNCIIDGVEFTRKTEAEKNNLLSGSEIDYDMVKAAGFNTMVVKMESDSAKIPSFDYPDSHTGCSMRFEYAGSPEKDVFVEGVDLDGQGTTSKKYFRWNLRAKTGSGTTWTYGDGTTETGKKGRVINDSSYIKVDRITAKKNYASSMQGHKMGFTGLYNDLFKECGLGSHLPNENYRTAVYQFPFVGFREYSTGAKEFIGIYTAGPDKGSKVTFGYSDNFMSLLSIEGPNHTPRGTRFLTPWVDVTYDQNEETLCFGGEEGWDADYVNYETSSKGTQADWDAILGLYESEWRPAYEIAYHCSPYIASLSDALTEGGYADIAAINADITNFFKKSTGGVANSVLSFYDSNYDIWFYRTKTGAFENLTTVEGNSLHNILTYLGLTGTPTTAQIIEARRVKFKADMENYWDLGQTLFHYCFCELFAVSDNHAKNTYPFKFRGFSEELAEGESVYCKRWGWREDDMDTVMMTDNNGNNTKKYSVEPGDLTYEGVQIFQGFNSSFWMLIHDCYQTEIANMMLTIANAATSLATDLGIASGGMHGSLLNLTSYYCWEHSAKYFAETLYEHDKRWSYIEPWLINPAQAYNNVMPLSQALGDQYQGEHLWMERRIAYIFSKYMIGAFSGATEGYNMIAFTLATTYTFRFIPAIDLYPVASSASTPVSGGRTDAGDESLPITVLGDGQTTNYIKGGDWLAELGDLCDMALSARGGGVKNFTVNCARILRLKVGDEDEENVLFNADVLAINSPSITEIDARNTTTLTNIIDLRSCPRLRRVLLEGSSAPGMYLPVGAKVTEVSFPEHSLVLFFVSLPLLDNEGLKLPDLAGVEDMYVSNCKRLNAFTILEDIVNTEGNTLQYATAIWEGVFPAQTTAFDSLVKMALLRGRTVYENGQIQRVDGVPYIEGGIDCSESDTPILFPSDIVVSLDETISTYVHRMWVSNFGTRLPILYDIDNIYPDNYVDDDWIWCYYNVTTTESATTLVSSNLSDLGANFIIDGETVARATSYTFSTTGEHLVKMYRSGYLRDYYKNVTALKRIYISRKVTYLYSSGCFSGCSNLTHIYLPPLTSGLPNETFRNCSSLTTVNLYNSSITKTGGGSYGGFMSMKIRKLRLPSTLTTISGSQEFRYSSIERVNFEDLVNLTSISSLAFTNCPLKGVLKFRSALTSIGNQAFQGCTYIEGVDLADTKLTTIQGNNSQTYATFYGCSRNKFVYLPKTLTSIGGQAFRNNTALVEVKCYADIPPTLGSYVFTGDSNLADIFVPLWSEDFYKEATGWTSFANIIKGLIDYDNGCINSIYDVTSTETDTTLLNQTTGLEETMLVNNSSQTTATSYLFSATGNQLVRYTPSAPSLSGTFNGITALKHCYLTAGVTAIGENMFKDCTALETLTILAAVPPYLDSTALGGTTSLTHIYVPSDSVDAYKAADGWSTYASIITAITE